MRGSWRWVRAIDTCEYLHGHPHGQERPSSLGPCFCPQGTPENPGINQRALQLLFSEVQEKASDWEYTITVSVAEIYNEVLRWEALSGAALAWVEASQAALWSSGAMWDGKWGLLEERSGGYTSGLCPEGLLVPGPFPRPVGRGRRGRRALSEASDRGTTFSLEMSSPYLQAIPGGDK